MPNKDYIKYRDEFTNPNARIPYDYYRKILLEDYGVVERKKSGGSARPFIVNGIPFVIHEPHKRDIPVGKWDHKNVLDILKRVGKL